MSDERASRIERMLEQTARKVSGGGLHPLEILQRVQDAVEGGVNDSYAPNDITIGLHRADYDRFSGTFERLRSDIGRLLDGIERERALRRIGERRLTFELNEAASEATPIVTARFVDTNVISANSPALGATRRIRRQRGATLVLSDGRRVAITHTPFAIGRGPGNDLVLPSLAVSRKHAQIEQSAEGLVIRDCGSRNGLVVNGRAGLAFPLARGVGVRLGDFELWLEEGA